MFLGNGKQANRCHFHVHLSSAAVESGSFASLAPSPVPTSICYCLSSAPAAVAGLPFVGPTYDTIAIQIMVTDTAENRLRTLCLQVHHTQVHAV